MDEEKLKRILGDILKIDKMLINNKTHHENVKNWDSFAHLHLVMVLESEFNIKFTPNEVISLLSYNKIKKILDKKKK